MTVLGAGIFGLCCAWALAARGASVQVIDPAGVGAGASGGVVGALAPHTPENWNDKKQFQFESLILSREFWPQVEAASGAPTGYLSVGREQPLRDGRAVALALTRTEGAQALWQGKASWEIRPKGQWDLAEDLPVVHDTLSAHLHPRQAVQALAQGLHQHGVSILKDGPHDGLVLHATGWAGLQAVSKHHSRTMGGGVKGQAAVFGCDARGLPQLYLDTLHIMPHANGTVAVGSTSENTFDQPTGTDAGLDAVIGQARALVPALQDAPVTQRWAGVRPRARSRAPMLGQYPGRPGQFIANGGFKIGFGMAPKVGQVMADLLLEGRQTYPDAFDVSASL